MNVKSINVKSILQYLFFVVISVAFWMIVSVYTMKGKEVTFTVKINAPKNVVFIDAIPEKIKVTVKDEVDLGYLKYIFNSKPTLVFEFSKYAVDDDVFTMTSDDIKSAIVDYDSELKIDKILPNSISLRFSKTGKKVPVVYDLTIKPKDNYVQSGAITKQDSVMVYGSKETLNDITEVYTNAKEILELTDTVNERVTLRRIKDARIVPEYIDVRIPVEPLIEKQRFVNVAVDNVPAGTSMLVFPSRVQVTYQVAKSHYKDPDKPISLYVDYNDITNSSSTNNYLDIIIGQNVSDNYLNLDFDPKRVRYLIKRAR